MGFAFWNRLRWAAWLAAGGALATLLVAEQFGPAAAWGAFWMVLAVAVSATVIAVRTRPLLDEARRARGDAEVSGLPPLARDILERLPDPLMLIDAAGRAIVVNRAMRGVIGVDAENRPVTALLRTPSVLEAIRQTTETGQTGSLEFSLPVPIQRNYQATVARTSGNPAVTIVLLHDLTAMKRAEQMRADFVANASHELRTPLAALSGFIETLKGHARDDLRAREQFLDIMTVEAERMRRLIDDLLSLTRIEQNEHVPPSGTTSLETILRDAVATLAPLARAENVALDISAAPGLPDAVGQRDELIQVFQNLIHNAIKYGRSGGNVWIRIGLTGDPGGRGGGQMLKVSVRDDGEGIPSDAIPRLTERFYRVDVKRSREKGGTGLGLAIVKHIVNRHQGRLVIESKSGEGSTFTVLLPAAAGVGARVTEVL
ncbi:MAG TPA: ATP-binding protein [Rhizomicrobium sp.]|jgi:two-component system phosphate regulon sensor histidine kinase PhoR|nr:ATP-binding protein [Rhizomicrobium sp.]